MFKVEMLLSFGMLSCIVYIYSEHGTSRCKMGGIDWIDLAQDMDRWRALVNAVLNLQFSQNVGNFLTSSEPVNFSRRTVLRGQWSITEFPGQNQRKFLLLDFRQV